MNAEEWFLVFRNAYGSDSAFVKLYKSGFSPKEYTKAMFELLRKMGEKAGYQIETERLRVDMTWSEKNNTMVAIEHENSANSVESLNSEINKLFMIDCPLRVLITYFKTTKFQDLAKELEEKMLKTLLDRNRFGFEFLVVLGSLDLADSASDEFWVAYRYFPQYKSQILAYP